MNSQSRIYKDKIDIDTNKVMDFWNQRAKEDKLNTVLLGNQKDNTEGTKRNEIEQELLFKFIGGFEHINILDIGCGIGRWANNFKEKYGKNFNYTGIDYCENFIVSNKKRFKDDSNIKFYLMATNNIDLGILDSTYDLVIINGVFMYVNDDDLVKSFEYVAKIAPKSIYLQESISMIDERLTLNQFYSDELKTNYSAIYRIPEDYEKLIKKYWGNFNIVETKIMLDDHSGARKETNARYWFLKNLKNS